MCFEILEFKVETLIDFAKEFFVVGLGREEGDFHSLKLRKSVVKRNLA